MAEHPDKTASESNRNLFWQVGLKCWDDDRLRTELLKRQNEEGLDINLVLFALWCAMQKRHLRPHSSIDAERDKWLERLIKPIRTLREASSQDGQLTLKDKLLAAELEAEKCYQGALLDCIDAMKALELQPAAILKLNLESSYFEESDMETIYQRLERFL